MRPVQWYGSPITLRPGTVSIPRGTARLGIFWRLGLIGLQITRSALHMSAIHSHTFPHAHRVLLTPTDGTPSCRRWVAGTFVTTALCATYTLTSRILLDKTRSLVFTTKPLLRNHAQNDAFGPPILPVGRAREQLTPYSYTRTEMFTPGPAD